LGADLTVPAVRLPAVVMHERLPLTLFHYSLSQTGTTGSRLGSPRRRM
jgi:hypothetical protein